MLVRFCSFVGWVERSETQQTYQAARHLQSCKVLGFTSFNPTYGACMKRSETQHITRSTMYRIFHQMTFRKPSK